MKNRDDYIKSHDKRLDILEREYRTLANFVSSLKLTYCPNCRHETLFSTVPLQYAIRIEWYKYKFSCLTCGTEYKDGLVPVNDT